MCATRKVTSTGEPKRKGRPPALGQEHIFALREVVAEHPQATLETVTHTLAQRCGSKVRIPTVRRGLKEMGVVRAKPIRLTGESTDSVYTL